MARKNILEYIKDNVVLFDGAFGTEIYSRGVYINACYDELNLSRPDLIREIHESYVRAGADALETNTFGANRIKLKAHGFGDKVKEINTRGVELAREVGSDDIWVAGSVGPIGLDIDFENEKNVESVSDIFKEQIKALAEASADLILLETFLNIEELKVAVNCAKEICDLPIMAQMTVDSDGNSGSLSIKEITAKLEESGADIIGLNCTLGPKQMLQILEQMKNLTSKPLSVMPNAGVPQRIEGRSIYMSSDEYMAEFTKRFILTGAKVVGGCCGTTASHIKAMRTTIRALIPKQREIAKVQINEKDKVFQPVDPKTKSKFAEKLLSGEFIHTVEMVPPRGINTEKVLKAAEKLKSVGIDAINIPDGPRAMSRMGAVYLAKILIDSVGIEPILHYACRDRNLLGMMSDFIGLQAIGIKNVLLITGDPPKMGDLPDATAVFDVDAIGLMGLVNNLNKGYDLGGNSAGEPTKYFSGVGVNPGAIDLNLEISRLHKKIEAGAEFAITQPVFDVAILETFLKKIQDIKIPIIAGVWPLVSYRNAEFMNNEVPGADVPQWIMDKMRSAETKEEARNIGITIARDTIAQIRDEVAGVQVSMPFGNVKYPLQVLGLE